MTVTLRIWTPKQNSTKTTKRRLVYSEHTITKYLSSYNKAYNTRTKKKVKFNFTGLTCERITGSKNDDERNERHDFLLQYKLA